MSIPDICLKVLPSTLVDYIVHFATKLKGASDQAVAQLALVPGCSEDNYSNYSNIVL